MSARQPRDSASDREQRRKRQPSARAFDVRPAEREVGRIGDGGDGAFDVVPAREPADRAIARIAASQNGAVTHDQLIQAGLEHSGIGRRSDRGLLHRIHRGVYVVGHEAYAPYARESAALLSVGDQTLISHSSAAILWGIAAAAA